MLFLFLVGYLIYKNCLIAKEKSKSMFLWGLLTFVAVIFCEILGMYMLITFFYPQFLQMKDISESAQVANAISNNILQSLFLLFCGFGGYLLIRYILERAKGQVETPPEE
jgi:hypothetical protein